MKQLESKVEEHRDQFNCPHIVFRCPTCKCLLAILCASNSKFDMEMGIPRDEYSEMEKRGKIRNVLRLQVDVRFVWSYKDKRYVSPPGFDGKRKFTRHDRKQVEISLKEYKRLLPIAGERTDMVQRQIKQMEDTLQNPPPPRDYGAEMIYEQDLFMSLEKQFVCCEQIAVVNLLPHMKYIIEETNANPRT